MDLDEKAINLHKKNKGKIEIRSKVPLESVDDLSLAYTPGVAAVSREISKNKELVYDLTSKGNMVAVVTDGSAVLGLGNIGPEAALPVMEGKAILFKELADINAFPIVLKTQDVEEIIRTVRNIAPGFGAINFEDISAPRCFEIEERLQDLGIPVFHDDQHGTAIVLLAALINASKVAGKNFEDLKVVISGAGAAGTAITKILQCSGMEKNVCIPVRDIIVCDSKGIIYKDRPGLGKVKENLAAVTNRNQMKGTLKEAMVGADVFIGVSSGGLVTKEMISSMNEKSIVFAMANPTPEIMPDVAKAGGAFIIATGRSDFPNQVNNVLAFPGVFKGALEARARQITSQMKIAAVRALSEMVQNPKPDNILPKPLDKKATEAVAEAVRIAASNGSFRDQS
ncbi:MAG: NADP-dependent malic enzyme [Patescibacteria group bacterium]